MSLVTENKIVRFLSVKIYHSIESFEKVKNAVVTTGTFDGVHLGHLKIINRLRKIAKAIDGETVLLTFSPHPRIVLFSDNSLKLISTKSEKIDLLRKAGIDHLIIHPFSREFSRLSSVEFVRDILVNKLGTSRLVIGYNHHFGRNREGSFEHLREFGPLYGFQVEEISAQDVEEVSVSSTKIRKALESGDVKTARAYLTHDFCLSGIVVKGNHLGHKIGFPTANIKVMDSHKLIPANGVYAVRVLVRGKEYKGMLNIGIRPTIDDSDKTIEVHIIDFDEEIYGEDVLVFFIEWVREEQKFESLDALKNQLIRDRIEVLK
jgi:riboflavin kinase/FMN adenylyltransferase